MVDNEAKLVKAQQEWREALNAARTDESTAEGNDGSGRGDNTMKAQVDNMLTGLNQSMEKISSVGTFNTAAAGMLGGNRSAERTARATEETARNTEDIVDRLGAGLAFG